ncbi:MULTISPECIES: histidine kinase [Vagococcus]|uniref:Two-component sensor kinase YesM n=1 Tax=Vagococcus fluvialis bH819 TaxID=1255619 RepID=A0A1X6WJS1_9ENTE|nr:MULTISPECIES: histidine kinase [Vagococcus]SLM84553.1 Two-component sensor kinase YesM [Vagococcus fluvialis bH819]HCM89982.1 hypothetical protein [Vagococcus sp.]
MNIKGNLMYRLLKIYSIALIVIITLFSFGISMIVNQEKSNRAERLSQNGLTRMSYFVEEKQAKVDDLANSIARSEQYYQGLTSYFSMNDSEFLAYTLKNNYVISNFTNYIEQITLTDKDVEFIAIDTQFSKERYLSDAKSLYGRKVKTIEKGNTLMLDSTIKPAGWNFIGNAYLGINRIPIDDMLDQLSVEFDTNIFLISDRGQMVYTNTKNKELEQNITEKLKKGVSFSSESFSNRYFVQEAQITNKQYRLISLVDKKEVSKNSRLFFLLMTLASLLISVVLLLLLYRLFNGYVFQINDILKTIKDVSEGKRNVRISQEDKKSELLDITIGINQMLESLNTFIRENYELELRQKEAEFSALQAQINPHFMYNTLEYIRMSALSEGMEDLSEVVFAFASILRNNISQSKVITLENELKFLEQYVYLYQMRYPKNIGYSFKIEEKLKKQEIPKFSLQPLIENYFAHGVDFRRINNAISVNVYQHNETIMIEIKDNGKGMTSDKLTEINDYLVGKREFTSESIGIKNVNERLKIIFDDKYRMLFKETKGGGVTILISIELK